MVSKEFISWLENTGKALEQEIKELTDKPITEQDRYISAYLDGELDMILRVSKALNEIDK